MRRSTRLPPALAILLVACGSDAASTPPPDSAPDSAADAAADSAPDSAADAAADAAADSAADSAADAAAAADSAPDAPPSGPLFYVATTGDDANDGSLARPWKTVSHAMTTVAAGATVRVRAGAYHERVRVGVSGTAAAPITLENMPGEIAVLDGAGVALSGQRGLVEIDSRSHLVVRGLEIRNYRSTSSAVPIGIFVTGSAVDVRLENNDVHDVVTTVESCAGAGGNAFGIAVYGTATTAISQLSIVGNRLHHLRTGCSESMAINGNVDGFEVLGNDVHDNDNIGIGVIGAEGTGPTVALDAARNGVIRGNTVANISSKTNPAYEGSLAADGIYVDGGRNVLIERNLVRNCDIGIELASEHAGKATSYVLVRDNLVYYSGSTGASMGGYDSMRGATDHCAFVNNTFYANGTELTLQFYVTTSLFRDNVLFDADSSFVEGATTGVTLDHNLQYSTGVADVFVTPGAPPNGAVAVDLRLAAGARAKSKDLGVAIPCPSGWTCPASWGATLNGDQDYAGGPRLVGAAVDLGAYEAP